MIKNWKALLASLLLSAAMFGAGAAFTSAAHAQSFAAVRGNRGSDANMLRARARLDGIIDQLQRDQRDYGGHRVAAIAEMQQARGQIEAALQYDRGH